MKRSLSLQTIFLPSLSLSHTSPPSLRPLAVFEFYAAEIGNNVFHFVFCFTVSPFFPPSYLYLVIFAPR